MIRKLEQKDKGNWAKLYNGYADFYKVEMKDEILKTVWSWLHDRIAKKATLDLYELK